MRRDEGDKQKVGGETHVTERGKITEDKSTEYHNEFMRKKERTADGQNSKVEGS